MSYSLISKQGAVAHIASVQGLEDVVNFIAGLRVWGPLKDFLDEGETVDIPGVLKDITLYTPYATNPDVRTTLDTIKSALERAQGWAAIGE